MCTKIVQLSFLDKIVHNIMKVGYARVSSTTQDLELQKHALLKAGCEKIFSESVSGKDNNRTELIKMIDSLRAKDTVVIYKIDRIARSLKGLIDIIELLKNKKVNLISLDSGDSVDTTSPMGKTFFQIAGVFAELERGMINTRTKAGIAKAKMVLSHLLRVSLESGISGVKN